MKKLTFKCQDKHQVTKLLSGRGELTVKPIPPFLLDVPQYPLCHLRRRAQVSKGLGHTGLGKCFYLSSL